MVARLSDEALERLARIGRPDGVKILLIPGTRIKSWIRNQDLNAEVGAEELGLSKVRSLSIFRGEASFFPGGGVAVKMPGSREF